MPLPLSTCIWKRLFFHCEPLWPHEPQASVIINLVRLHLHIPLTSEVRVEFLTQGAFNKLYSITSSALSKDYLFRVTLLVEPCIKTASEVATLRYLRRHTKLPVPEVIAHAVTSDNELGYEWMIMERLPGVCLRDVWPRFPGNMDSVVKLTSSTGITECSPVDWKRKKQITREIYAYSQELQNIPFRSIGSIYFRSDLERFGFENSVIETNDRDFVLGPLVSLRLFHGGIRTRTNRKLGPYRSEQEYISAWADIEQQEIEVAQTLDPSDPLYDEELVDGDPEAMHAIDALRGVISHLFTSSTDPTGYVLYHNDLSLANILVDPITFRVTGIVDWESVGTVPRWEGTYPQFISGPEINQLPFAGDDKLADDPARQESWEGWEKTKLRKIFGATL